MIMMGGRNSERRTKGRSLVRANSVASPKPASTPTPSSGVASPQPNSLTDDAESVDQSQDVAPSTSAVTPTALKSKRKSSVGSAASTGSKVKVLVEKFEGKEEKEVVKKEKKEEKEKEVKVKEEKEEKMESGE